MSPSEQAESKTTCQICARNIKANTGLIAHHGYQRPGSGWQSASCMGALHLPYEQSRDLIPEVIGTYKNRLEFTIKREQELMSDPPETLTVLGGYLRPGEIFTRPDGFDAAKNVESYFYGGYQGEHRSLVRSCRSDIRAIGYEIERLQSRYDNWQLK